MSYDTFIKQQFEEASTVLEQFLSNPDNFRSIEEAAALMADAVKNENKIFSCGNGGSFCDAMHFAEELTGKYREEREPIPAIAISDGGHISCTANDYGFERVFSRYIRGLGLKGDVLLAISTSGNSPNVLNAAEIAQQKGMKVVALTGNNGGKLAELATVELRVPFNGYADRIQEMHIKIIHTLIGLIEQMVEK